MNKIKWVKNKIAAKVQSAILVASLAALLGLLGWLLGGGKLALIVISGAAVLYLTGPMMSPAVILKINAGRLLSRSEAPQPHDVLQRLARRAELTRPPLLFYMPTDNMLAFTVGSRENAIIAVSEGLLRRLSWQELTAVLAHETSHIRHNDIRIMSFARLTGHFTQAISIFGQIMLLLNLPMILVGQVTIDLPIILLLIFSPTLSGLLQLALSRSREYNADISAVELTGNPEALAAALAKIDKYQKNMLSRHLWPMVPRLPRSSWLLTHPPTKERIRRLLKVRGHDLLNHDYPYSVMRNHYQIPMYRVSADSI